MGLYEGSYQFVLLTGPYEGLFHELSPYGGSVGKLVGGIPLIVVVVAAAVFVVATAIVATKALVAAKVAIAAKVVIVAKVVVASKVVVAAPL